jgi:hypothetical protein
MSRRGWLSWVLIHGTRRAIRHTNVRIEGGRERNYRRFRGQPAVMFCNMMRWAPVPSGDLEFPISMDMF